MVHLVSSKIYPPRLSINHRCIIKMHSFVIRLIVHTDMRSLFGVVEKQFQVWLARYPNMFAHGISLHIWIDHREEEFHPLLLEAKVAQDAFFRIFHLFIRMSRGCARCCRVMRILQAFTAAVLSVADADFRLDKRIIVLYRSRYRGRLRLTTWR